MPLFGPPNIEKMMNNRDVKGLVKVLKGEADPQLRAQAVQALLQIGDRQAVEPLYEALNDDNRGVQALSAIALGYFGDSRAVEGLIDTVDIGGEISIKLLGMLGGSEAVRPLIRIIENSYHAKSDAGIIAAAQALGNLGDTRAIQPLIHAQLVCNDPARPAIIKAITAFGASAVPPLMHRLAKGTDILPDRWESIRDRLEVVFLALGEPARDALVDSLDDFSTNFELLADTVALLKKMDGGLDSPKAKAADALVRGDETQIAGLGAEAEGLLTTFWKADGGEPRLNALIRIWGPQAADRLIDLVQDGTLGYTPKREAMKALGGLGDERAVPILAANLKDGFSKPQALEALAKINSPQAIQALETMLDFSVRDTLRITAAEALSKKSWSPRRDRVGAIYYATRGEWGCFMELGDEVTAPVVDEILKLSPGLETIALLETLPDPRTVDRLIACLENSDEKNRIAACHALGAKGDARALEALKMVEQSDSHSTGGELGSSNPWAYDHTGGGSDYWSEEESPYHYPVRDAAHAAIEQIKQKTA